MRFAYCWLLVSLTSLFGGEIPQEEGLQKSKLPNGVEIFLRKNSVPPHTASLRVVWKKEGKSTKCVVDTPWGDVQELSSFFESCKNDALASSTPESMAVIAVGDFPEEEMAAAIKATFAQMPQLSAVAPARQVVIKSDDALPQVEVSLNFPTPIGALENLNDLKKQWIFFFLQNLVTKRLQSSLAETHGVEVPQTESRFLLPNSICCTKARADVDNSLIVLAGYLVAVQELRQGGFTEEEFSTIKAKIQKNLLSSYRRVPDSMTLAGYFADQFSLGIGAPSYHFYMSTSLGLIPQITLPDIHQMLTVYMKDESRRVELAGPLDKSIDEPQIQLLLQNFQADIFHIVRHNQNDTEIKTDTASSYQQLAITEEEAEIIWKIIDTIADNNPIMLGLKKGDLERKGAKIANVHPLRFLGTIFSDPHLKVCMRDIRDSIFKWSAFMSGLGDQMDEEYKRGNLSPHIMGFCQAVHANPDHVRNYIQKKDWKGLVDYLIKLD